MQLVSGPLASMIVRVEAVVRAQHSLQQRLPFRIRPSDSFGASGSKNSDFTISSSIGESGKAVKLGVPRWLSITYDLMCCKTIGKLAKAAIN